MGLIILLKAHAALLSPWMSLAWLNRSFRQTCSPQVAPKAVLAVARPRLLAMRERPELANALGAG